MACPTAGYCQWLKWFKSQEQSKKEQGTEADKSFHKTELNVCMVWIVILKM